MCSGLDDVKLKQGTVLLFTNRKIQEPQISVFSLSDCLAKTTLGFDGVKHPGENVLTHGKLSGLVAERLFEICPASLRSFFVLCFKLAAAIHDVGKISPVFQKKIRQVIPEEFRSYWDLLNSVNIEIEKMTGFHWGVSQVSLETINKSMAEIIGCHHGYRSEISGLVATDNCFGGNPWQDSRIQFVKEMESFFGCELKDFAITTNGQKVFMAGLTTLSDWIASSIECPDNLQKDELKALAESAVEKAGFFPIRVKKGLEFSQVFPSFEARNIQEVFIDNVTGKGLYVLEAGMGEGKTEAALYAAYKLISQEKASGFYFALPTTLTSEKVWERVDRFVRNILEEDDPHSPFLIHGKSFLLNSSMGADAALGQSWFNQKKRALLAPFAVGTVDQALMAVLNVKHNFLRAFGLAGKVVVIDEVHSYDSYTGTAIEFLIERLLELNCPVFLLSATLTQERKQRFAGKLAEDGPCSSSFPLVSKFSDEGTEFFPGMASQEKEIKMSFTTDENYAIEKAKTQASSGSQVLWIENVVDKAQEIFRLLAAWGQENGIEIGLCHSRFVQNDRQRIEDRWVSIFGMEGREERRGKGRILIGTQVLEQSLNLDADFLISRIAPTDMIIQRMGRLWRYEKLKEYRPSGIECQVLIISPTLEEACSAPETAFGSTGYVYAPYYLVRSLEVLSRYERIRFPDDMRTLIEETYKPGQDNSESASLIGVRLEMEKKIADSRRLALNNLAPIGRESKEEVSTRYSDTETCQTLLLRSLEPLVLWDGSGISSPDSNSKQGKIAAFQRLTKNIVNVPIDKAVKGSSIPATVKALYYCEKDSFRLGLVLPSGGIVSTDGTEASVKYELCYDERLGYSARRKNGE